MKNNSFIKVLFVLMGLGLSTGCGGGGGGGGAVSPPSSNTPSQTQRQASLTVEGIPPGTRIYIDGQPQTSGQTVFILLPGSHEVVLARAGYTLQNSQEFKTVVVQAGENLKKTAQFSRMKPPKLTLPTL